MAAAAASAAAKAPVEVFTYKTPQGATFKVTSEGLVAITVVSCIAAVLFAAFAK